MDKNLVDVVATKVIQRLLERQEIEQWVTEQLETHRRYREALAAGKLPVATRSMRIEQFMRKGIRR